MVATPLQQLETLAQNWLTLLLGSFLDFILIQSLILPSSRTMARLYLRSKNLMRYLNLDFLKM